MNISLALLLQKKNTLVVALPVSPTVFCCFVGSGAFFKASVILADKTVTTYFEALKKEHLKKQVW